MPNTPITLTCADYARVMPLIAGDVKPDGIDLTVIHGRLGSWSDRAEMLRRALQDTSVHGGEASVAQHLYRVAKGDKNFIALPAFVLRNFTARDLYVLKDGPIKSPKDLPGKRIGVYSWAASGSVWYRHFLHHIEVPVDSLHWWVGTIDGPATWIRDKSLPANVQQPAEGRSLSDMLLDRELDVLYSPPRPQRFHPTNGPIVRLFKDVRPVDRDYYARTGVFPPQHLIVLRRDVWETDPSIARRLMDAFQRCNEAFDTQQWSFPYDTPWHDSDLEATRAIMGEDWHPYGIEKNRRAMEAFCAQAHDAGLVPRRISVEEYFAEFLKS
jgi:4,5-dihydroxyphthalate decarboxylase